MEAPPARRPARRPKRKPKLDPAAPKESLLGAVKPTELVAGCTGPFYRGEALSRAARPPFSSIMDVLSLDDLRMPVLRTARR